LESGAKDLELTGGLHLCSIKDSYCRQFRRISGNLSYSIFCAGILHALLLIIALECLSYGLFIELTAHYCIYVTK
jgi:hypothetical protein